MKKTLFFMLVALLAASCEKVVLSENDGTDARKMRNVRVHVNGDFGAPTFTRSLTADGKEMTDLWIFDYVDDEFVKMIHQTSDDDDFSEPNLLLTYGNHDLYFVASRGVDPEVDNEEHTITWSKVRDTFWQSVAMDVDESTASDIHVTLERVVSKLKMNINDVVPSSLMSITVTPEEWSHGMDYINCEPILDDESESTIDVPSSYHGTSGSLSLSVFTISGASEWTTDVSVAAKNSSNETIASVSIFDVPLLANRATVYSGYLFTSGSTFSFSLENAWLSDKVLTW